MISGLDLYTLENTQYKFRYFKHVYNWTEVSSTEMKIQIVTLGNPSLVNKK